MTPFLSEIKKNNIFLFQFQKVPKGNRQCVDDYRYPDGVKFFFSFISPPSRLTDGAIKDCHHTSAMRQLKKEREKHEEKQRREKIKIIEGEEEEKS
jgi:hypothetical protein